MAEVGADSGATALVEALRELDVDIAFGLPGVHNLPVWEACAAAGIRLVGVRHEQAAAYAADGYARATGRLGVAVVTTGPGAANTLGATGEAMTSGAPVLVLATDIPSTLRRPGVYRGVLHETRDQAAMFAPVTKAATTAGAASELRAAVLRAGRTALAAPTGPVYLGVPTDLLSQAAGSSQADPGLPAERPSSGGGGELREALAMVERAERPLLWVGGGALRAGAGDAVGLLAERLGAPVITTYNGRGVLPPDHPCLVPGPAHVPAIGALWDEADLVIAVGSDFDGMTTQNWRMPAPPALLAINVDAEDATKNYQPDLVLVGDALAVTERLAAAVPARDGRGGLTARIEGLRGEVAALVQEEEPQAALLLDALDRLVPADATVLADMCIAGYWVAGFHRVPGPRRLAYPMGWGTLGFAFPAALGAAAAGTGRAVAVVGDGGFLFACGELATAAQEQLPLTVVLVDDGGYGMLRFDQVQAGVPTRGVDLATPDFVALAAAFGVPGEQVDGFGDAFEAALAKSLDADGPNLIAVRAALTPPPSTSPRWYRAKAPQ